MNLKTVIYIFPDYAPEIYADEKGVFWTIADDMMVKTKYYNGRICVQFGVKRYGIKKLRENAKKSQKEATICPF
jgi:hypothetical protein